MSDDSLPPLREPCTCTAMHEECPACRAWRRQHGPPGWPAHPPAPPRTQQALRTRLQRQLAQIDRQLATATRHKDATRLREFRRQHHNVRRRLARLLPPAENSLHKISFSEFPTED